MHLLRISGNEGSFHLSYIKTFFSSDDHVGNEETGRYMVKTPPMLWEW